MLLRSTICQCPLLHSRSCSNGVVQPRDPRFRSFSRTRCRDTLECGTTCRSASEEIRSGVWGIPQDVWNDQHVLIVGLIIVIGGSEEIMIRGLWAIILLVVARAATLSSDNKRECKCILAVREPRMSLLSKEIRCESDNNWNCTRIILEFSPAVLGDDLAVTNSVISNK